MDTSSADNRSRSGTRGEPGAGRAPAASGGRADGDQIYGQDKLSIPKIELPKGGGALKGIDEKFKVNAANGTASLSIPLPLTKSRGGFAPSLSLDYNSGGGNGLFGLGWNLSLGAIQRRTDKRLPEYDDAGESDVFTLSGEEDLVPLLLDDGSWSPDAFTAPTGEAVKRYRPRMEGSFSRIERVTAQGATTFFWKVTSKDNVVTLYGSSDATRVFDPSVPGRVFKWLPELSYDDKGNCVEYTYLPEDFRNVGKTLHEGNRLNGLAPGANRHLKQVSYGNKAPYYPDPAKPYAPAAPGAPGYFFELVFDYGDHDATAPTLVPQVAWPCRLDPFSDYKPGFEIRTYRLCRRVLLFHTFKELNDGVNPAPCLVRSLDIDYRYLGNPAATPGELRNLEADYPVAMRQTGWVRTGPASYITKSTPAVQMTYQELSWDRTVLTVDAADIANAPVGLGGGYSFVDLWSEGVSGILTEQAGSWFYKNNLGGGQFAPARAVATKPSFAGLGNAALQLQDLEADGRKFLVVNQPPLHGAFALGDDGQWAPFAPFRHVANVAANDPDMKLIDLDGDGRPEIAVSEEAVFTWYPSLGADGYGAPRRAPKPYDEEKGPALVFSDSTGSIYLANMSGGGLSDIVRVRNGEVCYWPNLGYGRFGAKVSMDFAPVFDAQDQFNPRYLQLADVSGTGATDIVYLGKGKFRAWINQAGNSWSEVTEIDPFPSTEQPNQITVCDLLGNGTASLVWSSPLPRHSAAPMRYIDLMGGKKPYLLNGYKNQAGKEVTLEYKSSTFFYLADQRAGTPWITKLPFPVRCLAKSISRDTVTGAQLVSEYSYHHGYYDHAEREYRGFGRVDQTDAESFDNYVKNGGIADHPLDQAPVLTRTWFHTGVYFGEDDLLTRYRAEYFQNADFAEHHLPLPQAGVALSPQEQREAQRACKGKTIRLEVYGLDGIAGVSTVPYSVSEHNHLIRRVQPVNGNRYAAFLVTECESITYEYERLAKDPRIAHTLNVAIDLYGNVLETASVAYPRQPGGPAVPPRVQEEQQRLLISYTVNGYTVDWVDAASHRLRKPCETANFEVTGVTPLADYFAAAEIGGAFATAAPIGYEIAPDGSKQKRALKHSRTLLLADDLSGPLPLGQMQALGLDYETYRLTFTAPLLTSLYGTRVTPTFLAEAAYALSDDLKAGGLFPGSDADGMWWAHPGHATYPPAASSAFYAPAAYVDPFGKATTIAYYADYYLPVQEVTDAVGNVTSVEEFDFRHLTPLLVKDANANLAAVRYDALGMLVGTALMGKGAEADDFTAFVTDLSPADIAGFFADPAGTGAALLQHATSRFVYDLSAVPLRVGTIARETHYQVALAAGTASKLTYGFEYSDGFGNVAMRKAQTTPGIALALDGAGNVIQVDTTPNLRWIGTGRTVQNNKGKPVKQYEPYFSTTPAYESDPQLVQIGVTPLIYYDPPGRNVRTEYPDGTFSKTVIQGWMTQSFDRNDTVTDSDWYALRTTGVLAGDPQENQAALKAAVHYATPGVTHADTLGRAFYEVSHNKYIDHTTHALTEKFYEVDSQIDIEAKMHAMIDPRGNAVERYAYDMLGNRGHSNAMDAGERWLLNDCAGHPLYSFDSKTQTFHTIYDAVRRPTDKTVAVGAGTPIVFDRTSYGEGVAGDQANNLRGRVHEHRDQAGIMASKSYDFKGNLLETTRVLTDGYDADVNWNAPPLMQPDTYTTRTEYDALKRPVRIEAPSAAAATASVLLPGYNESGHLDSVTAHVHGAAGATGFVNKITYNEKGQRARIDYANGASTIYKYDPLTFRLSALVTARGADPEIFWDDESKISLPAYEGDVLQFLTYTYDPVGNVTYIKDDAQQTIYFDNRRIEPSADYTYDAVYWLVQSLGREQIGGHVAPGPFDDPRMGNPNPGDGLQLQTYTLQYDYDDAGNMTAMGNIGNWSMAFDYAATTNQMKHAVPGGFVGTPFSYPYDAHGNATAMPHLTVMEWDFADRLRHTQVSASGSITQESWYVYDAGGQRVRKVVVNGNLIEERIYLGSIELFRRSRAGSDELRRETLQVTDDARRIAMVDTPTLLPAGSTETQLTRFQYVNHLDTAALELDAAARIISYEEYYPFGSTSYQGTDQSREIPAKRYRYIGKERDEESGFSYCGSRYYAPWLARWISPDPEGTKDGPNLYGYCRNNPVKLHDPTGTQGKNPQAAETDTRVTESHSETTVSYDAPGQDDVLPSQRVRLGIPPFEREGGNPSTVFGNQTQSLGTGLADGDPSALGGSLTYRRGIPGYRYQSFRYLDFEANLIPSASGQLTSHPLVLGEGFLTQLSLRGAPFGRLPGLTVGGYVNAGPAGQRGLPGTTQFGGGGTAQYGWRLRPGLGVGIFTQGYVSGSTQSGGGTSYGGTVTPIIQYQPNDRTQWVFNPTVSAGNSGNFVNLRSYNTYVTGGFLAGLQKNSFWIAEAGVTYTGLPGAAAHDPTGEVRVITGFGVTGNPTPGVTLSAVLNPILGIPTGGDAANRGPVALAGMITLTAAWRIPTFRVQPNPPDPLR